MARCTASPQPSRLDPKESCIEVKYTGSLPSDIKMYRVPGALGSLAPYANLKVEYGTQASPSLPVLHRLQRRRDAVQR